MKAQIFRALVLFFLVIAVLGVIVWFTKAHLELLNANLFFLAFASLSFLASIAMWLTAWGHLVKRSHDLEVSKSIVVGLSCLYGALTPMQFGAEALRALKLKQSYRVPYSDSISASMVAKGLKFLILAIMASFLIFSFMLAAASSPLLFWGFLSGFAVVVLAALFFLLPLNPHFGRSISAFFGSLGKRFHFLARLSFKLQEFFRNYSNYLNRVSLNSFLIVFALVAVSWGLEFLALQFSFLALSIDIPTASVLVLLVLTGILERTPFIPRGIGLVEIVGYTFLAFPALAHSSLTIPQIGAVLIVFDIARLVVPTLVGIGMEAALSARR